MDDYSKALLTIIAFLLGAIAYKLWQPSPGPINVMDTVVTTGAIEQALKLPEPERTTDLQKLNSNIPLVKVMGLTQVYGTVDIGNDVNVGSTVNVKGSVYCSKF